MSAKSEDTGLITTVIKFQYNPTYVVSDINITDGQTDIVRWQYPLMQ